MDNITKLPTQSEYYKTVNGKPFLFYRSENMLIFMIELQAQYLYKIKEHLFIDGTFYSAPKCSYQIGTIRSHNILEDFYHTLCYGILNDKGSASYIEYLDNIKTYVYNSRENKNINSLWEPITIHCDFELSLIKAFKQVFDSTEIKLFLWHFYRNIEFNRKKINGSIDNMNQQSLNSM